MDDLQPDTRRGLNLVEKYIWSFAKMLDADQRHAFKIHLIAWIQENL